MNRKLTALAVRARHGKARWNGAQRVWRCRCGAVMEDVTAYRIHVKSAARKGCGRRFNQRAALLWLFFGTIMTPSALTSVQTLTAASSHSPIAVVISAIGLAFTLATVVFVAVFGKRFL